jgi:AcrR family transcriptional regulator
MLTAVTDVKTSRREMYAALTRSAVLDAAQTLFVTKGFDATSVDDIAQMSQSSKGAVYHHFRDKQEIFAEAFVGIQSDVIRTALDAIDDDHTPWQRVEAATGAFLRGYVANDAARAMLRQVMGVLGWDRVRAIDEQMALPLVRAMIEETIRSGDVDETIPVDTAADLLYSLYCNAVLVIAASADPGNAAHESEQIIYAMLRGLRTGGDHNR